jgi:hypothetical protein
MGGPTNKIVESEGGTSERWRSYARSSQSSNEAPKATRPTASVSFAPKNSELK